MTEVFVLAGARTPRGKGSPKGALHAVPAIRLVTHVLDALPVREADDLILGCATQIDDQGANLARAATLLAGWPVPGLTINRFCASGLEAVALAASRIRAGDGSLIVAGGVESVSRVPTFADRGPLYADRATMEAAGTIHMGVAADLVATLDGIDREACDRYAHETRTKARLAAPPRSIIPLAGLASDENVAFQPTLDELAAMPPLFGELGQDSIALARFPQLSAIHHVHTRGSSPSLADAAALLVIGDRAAADRTGLAPRARILASASLGGDPVTMLTVGQAAIARALTRAGLRLADIDLVYFAEAFAALCVRLMRDLELSHDRLNPEGGTIALGHAYGATGAALLVDALDALERRGGRRAVVAVSGAAGLGSALVIERL